MQTMPVPTSAALSIDVPCIHCGYNLRGLVPGGMCPECGHAIDESLRGDLLRFANPDWLRKLRLGIALQLWAIGLGIVLGAVGGALVVGLGMGPSVFQVAQWAPMLIGIWGTLALTTREPRDTLQDEGLSVRTFLRTTACLLPVFQVVYISADLLPQAVLLAVTMAGFFLWPLQYALFLVFLRRFAVRVPDEKLHRSSTRLVYVGSVGYGLYTALAAYSYFRFFLGLTPTQLAAAPAGPPAMGMILGVAMSILSLVVLVLFLWYVRLLSKYRKVLAEQVRLAEGSMV